MGGAAWRTDKSQASKMHERIVDKYQQHGAKDKVARIDGEASCCLYCLVRQVARESRGQQEDDEGSKAGVPLKDQPEERLRPVARMKHFSFQIRLHLTILLKRLAEDHEVDD